MAYIGNQLQTAQPNYQIIDDISGSFDGTTTTFALQVAGVTPTPFPVSAQHCIISVGGVVQEPDPTGTNGFLLSGSNIVFSSAPSSGESFFGTVLAGADYINVGASFPDGSVANPSITFDQDLDTGLYRSASGTTSISANGANVADFGPSQLTFNTAGSERVRVDSSGNVGIGTTTPSNMLHIEGASPSIRLKVTSGPRHMISPFSGDLYIESDPDNTSASTNTIFTVDGTERLRISEAGKLTSLATYTGTTTGGGPVYVESNGDMKRFVSSIRWKADVETAEDKYADAILNCRPVYYRSLCEGDKENFRWWGFIAEEVAEIDPRLVNWRTTETTYDEKGTPITVDLEPEDYVEEGVRYDNFVPLLVNLVKRQKEQIETQSTAIAALETRLTALEGGAS
jgi:hypothetical protein